MIVVRRAGFVIVAVECRLQLDSSRRGRARVIVIEEQMRGDSERATGREQEPDQCHEHEQSLESSHRLIMAWVSCMRKSIGRRFIAEAPSPFVADLNRSTLFEAGGGFLIVPAPRGV
ncbi:MAG: hypothetical protein JNK60_11415 [Acidobacteria bacterium]|nr:hypothetical protein [Acidobacteriota bacterium]